MTSTKAIIAVHSTSESESFLSKIAGTWVVGSFIVVWLSSLASPFLLMFSLMCGYNAVASFIIIVTILSYLPWTKGPIPRQVQLFYHRYHPCYYQETKIIFHGDRLPNATTDPQTLFAIHPHGAFCLGWSLLFAFPALDHVRFCFSPALFASPFFRLFSRCVGNPGSASRGAMQAYLKAGLSVALPPGGFEEATVSCVEQDRAYIKKRTGFIKLCLKCGVAVRPVYAFGEKSLFWNIQGMWKFRLAMNRYGAPMILVWGRPLIPFLPKTNVKLHIVVGEPLILPKIQDPSKEDVSVWHEKYMAALTKLFEDYKEEAYGSEAAKVAKLELW